MSSNTSVKKRFIAGARCNACQLQDKVMIFITADDEWIECVECGHTEKRPASVVSKGSFDNVLTEQTDTEQMNVVQFKPMR